MRLPHPAPSPPAPRTHTQALKGAPPDKALPLFLEYAKLEEQHGLARHAMEVYQRALPAVPKAERIKVLDMYIARCARRGGPGGGGGAAAAGWAPRACQVCARAPPCTAQLPSAGRPQVPACMLQPWSGSPPVCGFRGCRATDFFGIAKVREVYESAIEATPPGELADTDVRDICVRYAQVRISAYIKGRGELKQALRTGRRVQALKQLLAATAGVHRSCLLQALECTAAACAP